MDSTCLPALKPTRHSYHGKLAISAHLLVLAVSAGLVFRGSALAGAQGEPDSAGGESVADTVAPGDDDGNGSTSTSRWRWNSHWQDGFHFALEHDVASWRWGWLTARSRTEKFSGKIGMRLEVDAGTFASSPGLDFLEPGVELRRLRLYSRGEFDTVFPIHYKVEIGLVQDEFQLHDVYVWFQEIPWVETLKVGHFKTPMTLAGYGSSRDTVGMEVASPVEAFAPGVKLGVQAGKAGLANRFSWALGLFTDAEQLELGDASESKGRVVGRMTGLPLFRDEEGGVYRLIHLGVSSSYVFAKLDNVRYRSRPETFLSPRLVDTGNLGASDSALITGVEFAWVNGPASIQAEYLLSNVEPTVGRPLQFDGGYVMGSVFLTGEHRPYRRDVGVFDRPVPRRPFSLIHGGVGAVELFGRLSHLDLNDGPVRGGQMSVLSGGVNWYWSRNVKLRFDYNHAEVEDGPYEGTARIFQTRLQIAY